VLQGPEEYLEDQAVKNVLAAVEGHIQGGRFPERVYGTIKAEASPLRLLAVADLLTRVANSTRS
jgi:hypothetical protein